MDFLELKERQDNPRKITSKKFEVLKESISKFPEMMALNPIVCDEEGYILAGTMRARALKELGYTNVSENWIKMATGLTDEQKKQFIIKDNVHSGQWDRLKFDEFKGLDIPELNLCLPESEEAPPAKLEIVPDFFENHTCFLIPISNTMDEQFIRDNFDLNDTIQTVDKKKVKSTVISVEVLRAKING